jgi:multicomponent Na+:H+ antiporter subunit C
VNLLPYLVAGWLLLIGCFGVVRSRDLIHTVVCVAVAQSGTYVLLLSIGFQYGASAPVQGAPGPVVDPVVQALTLTDIVVSATVTALLLALVIQIAKRTDTVEPDKLDELRG